tara:strand:+ start:23513 stop:23809 length:297 start_codon:yes stop_codon:yes gene_type:complete
VEFGRHIGLKIRGFFKREGSNPSIPINSSSSTTKEQEDMSTIKQVNNEVKELRKTVSTMSSRINQLVDEIHILRSEVNRFKSDVAGDITSLENMHKGR